MNNPLIVYHSSSLKHLQGIEHPEKPERISAIQSHLETIGLMHESNTLLARKANEPAITRVHTKQYFELVQHEVSIAPKSGGQFLSTGDVVITPDSLEAALYAAGAGLTAADAIMKGKSSKAFCLVRPPGHHAERSIGMGFCLFNNAAITARYLQDAYQLKRILIIDWDYHHGNGTQDIFYDDPDFYYFSTHDILSFPGTGHAEEKGRYGNICNIPISEGFESRHQLLQAYEKALPMFAERSQPEFIIISCGFDAHKDDPIGRFNLENDDFGILTELVVKIAHDYTGDRLISILEGGYNLTALPLAAESHIRMLM